MSGGSSAGMLRGAHDDAGSPGTATLATQSMSSSGCTPERIGSLCRRCAVGWSQPLSHNRRGRDRTRLRLRMTIPERGLRHANGNIWTSALTGPSCTRPAPLVVPITLRVSRKTIAPPEPLTSISHSRAPRAWSANRGEFTVSYSTSRPTS